MPSTSRARRASPASLSWAVYGGAFVPKPRHEIGGRALRLEQVDVTRLDPAARISLSTDCSKLSTTSRSASAQPAARRRPARRAARPIGREVRGVLDLGDEAEHAARRSLGVVDQLEQVAQAQDAGTCRRSSPSAGAAAAAARSARSVDSSAQVKSSVNQPGDGDAVDRLGRAPAGELRMPRDVGRARDLVLVTQHEHAVPRRHDVRLDRVGAEGERRVRRTPGCARDGTRSHRDDRRSSVGGVEVTPDRLISLHDCLRELRPRAAACVEVLHLLRNPHRGSRDRPSLAPAPGPGVVGSRRHRLAPRILAGPHVRARVRPVPRPGRRRSSRSVRPRRWPPHPTSIPSRRSGPSRWVIARRCAPPSPPPRSPRPRRPPSRSTRARTPRRPNSRPSWPTREAPLELEAPVEETEPDPEPEPAAEAPVNEKPAKKKAPIKVFPDEEPDLDAELEDTGMRVDRTGRVNLLAVLALLLGILASPLAALFGHVALGQLRASGEARRHSGVDRDRARLPVARLLPRARDHVSRHEWLSPRPRRDRPAGVNPAPGSHCGGVRGAREAGRARAHRRRRCRDRRHHCLHGLARHRRHPRARPRGGPSCRRAAGGASPSCCRRHSRWPFCSRDRPTWPSWLSPILCWLLVRHRPLRVWPMAAFVIASGIVLARIFPEYSGMLPALGVQAGILVGAAWAARAVHAASSRRSVCAPGERSGGGAQPLRRMGAQPRAKSRTSWPTRPSPIHPSSLHAQPPRLPQHPPSRLPATSRNSTHSPTRRRSRWSG